MIALVLALALAAPVQIDSPPFDPLPGGSCQTTVVEVHPRGRLVAMQIDGDADPRNPRPNRRRVTTLAGLPGVLKGWPNRCNALVAAAGNAPAMAVAPVYAALRAAGFRYFGSVDASSLKDDPGWR